MIRFSLLLAAVLLAPAESPVEAALRHFEAGEYAKAVEAAEKVPAGDADFAKSRYRCGEARLALGEAEAAGKEFRAGLEAKPESGPLRSGLGRSLLAMAKFEEAEEALRKAVKIDPKDPASHRALGECILLRKRDGNAFPEARKELELAAKLDPKDPLSARSLVEALLRNGETEPAGRAAEVHAKSVPKGAMGPFLRGLVLDRDGRSKDAIEAYETALARDPKFLDAHKNLAILCVTDNPSYTNRERTEKAMEHFAKYFELGGKDEELRSSYETMKSFLEGEVKRRGR